MSDECLMKQEMVFPFYVVYQAVMRKFTLAGKSIPLLKHRGVCRAEGGEKPPKSEGGGSERQRAGLRGVG